MVTNTFKLNYKKKNSFFLILALQTVGLFRVGVSKKRLKEVIKL